MEDYLDILKEARGQLRTGGDSIAVKDLTLCPRKKVFSIIHPVRISDDELYDYVSGKAAHDVLERLFMVYPHRFRSEKEIQYANVRGKIDIYDKETNNIIDLKTSKSQRILLKPFKFHEEQLRYYMAILGSEEGQIIYQMDKFGKYLVFPIYMTDEQQMSQLEKLEREATLLQKAIDRKDPSLVKGIYDDPDMSWMCKKCPYLEKCMGIRNIEVNSAGVA